MAVEKESFVPGVALVLERYLRQNDQPVPPAEEVLALAERLWALVQERGLPRPLAASERGASGDMSDAEVAPLLDRVLAGTSVEWREPLTSPVRQLVKACFYPEFKTCRDSFREVSPDGSCRRQQLARARVRVSGSHCVDCPHWVALSPEKHARYLAREWRTNAEDFFAHQPIFLPEDFRALRLVLYRAARTS